MRTKRSGPCPRPRSLRSGAFFIGVLGALALPAAQPVAAQEEAQDTLPPREARDRRPPPQDTLAPDTVDSVPPPPKLLPPLEPPGPSGWSAGVWQWDRQDLLRLPNLSLLQLLERIPGMVPVRADIAAQPEAAAVFGAAAGGISYIVDGFALDPLTSPTFDPSRLGLLALKRVRVERRVTGATVRVETLAPDDGRTKSVIQAGTGDYDTNLFRGLFLPPRVLRGALGLGFERLSSDGYLPGAGNHTVTWLKWTWARDSAGVQVAYRNSSIDRVGVGPSVSGGRTDWVVRARGVLGPVTGEVYSGATSVENDVGGEGGGTLREGSPQLGIRLGTAVEAPVPLDALLAFRYRDHPRLPGQELELQLRSRPVPWLGVEGTALQGWWSTAGGNTGRWSARVALGPVLGTEAFAEVTRGGALLGGGPELRLPVLGDSGGMRVTRRGTRAGLRFGIGGLALGGAAVSLSSDTVLPFGQPMEASFPVTAAGDARGFEAMARIPTGVGPFTLEGWYVGMDAPDGWLYLPRHHWRAALVYHHLPLPSGNLELYARAEHVYRGGMNVPVAPDSSGAPSYAPVPAYRATGLEVVIRVLTVRAFIRWNNVLHRLGQQDLPDFVLPGQNILWGVKWEFWN